MFVSRVLLRKLFLDLGARLPFPTSVRDLAEAVDRRHIQSVRLHDEAGRVHGSNHRTGKRYVEWIGGEALAEQPRLLASFVRQLHIDRAGEAILGR